MRFMLNRFMVAMVMMLSTMQVADAQNLSPDNKLEKLYPVVDSIFRAAAQRNHFPGFVYGIVADGKLIHTGNMGHANLENKIAASPQSAFRIASMTKSFASVAILILRDEGKLKLDDPVSEYIVEMKQQKMLTADAPPPTIRHLLTHGAGFPEDNPWGDRQLGISEEEMLAMFRKGISFSTVPGTSYEYSNMGFAMLGYIIKKVSGMPYQQFINTRILKPLGMNNTYWEYDEVPANTLAIGYRWVNGKWVKQPMEHDGAYGIMGGMITTMEDYAKYVAFQLSAWPARDGKEDGPLKRSSLREMQQPWNFSSLQANYRYPSGRPCAAVSAYGYGLRWTKDCSGRISVGHSGGLPGFGSNWTMLPEYGIAVISFINLTYAPASYLNTMVLDTMLQLTGMKPLALPVSAILKTRQQQLVEILPSWKKEKLNEVFAENFFLDNFIDSLRKESAEIFSKAGKIISVEEMVPENNLRGHFMMKGEKGDVWVYFTLSPENPALVQEYDIRFLPK